MLIRFTGYSYAVFPYYARNFRSMYAAVTTNALRPDVVQGFYLNL